MGGLTASMLALMVLGATGGWLRRRYMVARVVGSSMLPTLAPDDRVLARRRSAQDVHVGQIVIVRRPERDPQLEDELVERTPYIVKRVVAAAGATARPEWLPATFAFPATVPAGMLVLLGDNAEMSCDSRYTGYYPVSDVLAVAVRRLG